MTSRFCSTSFPNHTSDQHPWFLESRSSRDNPKRDWYIWHDPAPDGGPPTNWLSEFGGSAWEFDAATGQFYYHAFLAAQPDLNWRNPHVREVMYDVMRFWLARGIDGFRVDVMWHLIKDAQFRDNPRNPNFAPGQPPHEIVLPIYTTDRPEVHEVVREMRTVVDEFDDRVLIGEIYLPLDKLVTYYGPDQKGANLPFNFALLSAPWQARIIASLIKSYEAALPSGGWPNWVLGNHDRPRVATRLGDAQARIAAMLLLTLRGTPTLYYGDEIGMHQAHIPPDRVRDPFEKNVPGIGVGRDGCRTPMRWTQTANAGFSHGCPWLPMGDDLATLNVEAEKSDATSIFCLYRGLLRLRQSQPALISGTYRTITSNGTVLMYRRDTEKNSLFVALNFDDAPATVQLGRMSGTILLSTYMDTHCTGDSKTIAQEEFTLRPGEGVIVAVASLAL